MTREITITGLLILCVLFLAKPIQANELPPDSIYHLDVELQKQTGEYAGFDAYRGHPTIVTMFYASCPHVCPMLVSTVKLTEAQLADEQQAKLRVLAISVDPERDDPQKLTTTFQDHSLDASRWSMTRPAAGDVRAIAGLLGIKYKQLPDGEFSHSTKLLLLDAEGRILATSTKLGRYDPDFLEAIRESLK